MTRCEMRVVLAMSLAIVVLGWNITGCQSNNAPKTDKASQNLSDAEWLNGADRPPTSHTMFATAKILAAQGRDAQCEFALKRILKEDPQFLPAYVELAELYLRQRQYPMAAETLNAGLRIKGNDSVMLNDLGMIRLIQGQNQQAYDYFQKAASAAPWDTRYRGNMALALGMMERYEEAVVLYEQIVSPEEARHNVWTIAHIKGNDAKAQEEIEAYERLQPSTQPTTMTAVPVQQ